jgi:hypothetical protein
MAIPGYTPTTNPRTPAKNGKAKCSGNTADTPSVIPAASNPLSKTNASGAENAKPFVYLFYEYRLRSSLAERKGVTEKAVI